MTATPESARPALRLRTLAYVAVALLLSLPAAAGVRADEDDLPDPVVRRLPSERGASPAPLPATPARPPTQLRRDAPGPTTGRTAPGVRPPLRPGPPAPPPQPMPGSSRRSAPIPRLAPGELPAPRIRRIPADPALRVPGFEQPLHPVPAPASGRPPARPDDVVTPGRPPSRPTDDPRALPGDVTFEVDEERGLLQGVDAGGGVAAILMFGNPRIRRSAGADPDGNFVPALTVKADRIVAWVDPSEFPQFKGLSALGGGTDMPGGSAPGRAATIELGDRASVIPQALREIYAEGAVELDFGDVVFRADRLYLDPHKFVALLVKPRFDGAVAGETGGVAQHLPLHIRAQRARLIGKGILVFDQAEASTSRAEDRLVLRIEELTVEEYQDGRRPDDSGEPHLLGYRRSSTQMLTGRRIQIRGERVPLFYVPELSFGYSAEGSPFPSVIQGIDLGRRGGLGWATFVNLGGDVSPGGRKVGEWAVDVGGYFERGPMAGGTFAWNTWKRPSGFRSFGAARADGIRDFSGVDRSGFVATEEYRWRALTASRTRITDDLHFDFEFADFSDPGFNLEFFEREQLEHKPYESYGRLYWKPERPGSVVVTGTGLWNQRAWATETTLEPQIGVWALGLPLLVPSRRGGFGLDVNSYSDVGRLGRHFGDLAPPGSDDYESFRASTSTTLNGSVEAGDLRFTGFVGGAVDHYWQWTEGSDITRSAMLAGGSVNMQLSRVYGARGGPFDLDGLRHVIDLDLGYAGRFFDTEPLTAVPYFDRRETERDRSTIVVRMRNRAQTRRSRPREPRLGVYDRPLPQTEPARPELALGLRNVLDVDTAVFFYPDARGPYLRESRGAFSTYALGEVSDHVNVFGRLWVDFERGSEFGSVGSTYQRGIGGKGSILAGGALTFVKNDSLAVRGDVAWRYSEKYGVRGQTVYDFRRGASTFRMFIRRYSKDHIFEFGFRYRQGDSVGVEFNLEPAIGGLPTQETRIFRNEPGLNPRPGTLGP